jgi:hypothetical protein
MKKISIFAFIITLSLFGESDFNLNDEVETEISNKTEKQIVSIEFGFGTISRLEADTISKNSSIDKNVQITGIKLGAEDIGLRLFLSYRPIVVENTFTNSFGIELDSTIDLNNKIKFFYGISLGTIIYKIVDKNDTSSFNKKTTGYYGLEGGFIFNILENIELESGMRYMITNLNDSSAGTSYMFDQYMNYYLALNIKY